MRLISKAGLLGLAVAVAGSLVSVAADAPASTSTHPPKNLKKVGDHWTPWDPPQPAAGAYVIQNHDTLWDLAGKWLGDPHLWPQVWDQNRYVLDSHWIYPGDPLNVPAKPNVVPPEGPATSSQTGAETGQTGQAGAAQTAQVEQPPQEHAAPSAPARPALIRLADQHDLYCSGWVEGKHHPSMLVIAGAEMEKVGQATGDVVFLNQGRNQGIEAGAEYLVAHPDHAVIHPATHEPMGVYMQRMGRVRVLCTQDNTATALILDSCEDIRPGFELFPWTDMDSPEVAHIPSVDACTVPSGLAQGWIVDGGADELNAVGAGNVVATDLGRDAGVRPGSLLTLFRDNGDLPRLILGQAVVLTIDGDTSTVKVLHTSRDVRRGDRVEVMQQ